MVKNKLKDRLIRFLSIFLVGIIMPVIFYDDSDSGGLLTWMIISVFLTLIFWEGSIRVVSFIWNKFPFDKNIVLHIIANFLYLSVLSVFVVILIFVIHKLFYQVSENYWQEMKGVHFAVILVAFFTTSIHEGIFIFIKWKESFIQKTELEKEHIQSQLDVLKNQLNPHFLFNSLSILSSTIPVDPEKAVIFVNKLSDIFRYSLEHRDENTVKVSEELTFIKSYILLQKMRFNNNLVFNIQTEKHISDNYILPFSIQILIENAIKHNEISDKYPLKINIFNTNEFIIVENNLQAINVTGESFKVGIKNLKKRYKLISGSKPVFYEKDNMFIAKIPIIKNHII